MHGAVGAVVVFCAPTSPNNDLLNDGVILEKYNKAVNVAVGKSFTFLFAQTQTPRVFFLEAQRLVLMICTDGWIRRPEGRWTVGTLEVHPMNLKNF